MAIAGSSRGSPDATAPVTTPIMPSRPTTASNSSSPVGLGAAAFFDPVADAWVPRNSEGFGPGQQARCPHQPVRLPPFAPARPRRAWLPGVLVVLAWIGLGRHDAAGAVEQIGQGSGERPKGDPRPELRGSEESPAGQSSLADLVYSPASRTASPRRFPRSGGGVPPTSSPRPSCRCSRLVRLARADRTACAARRRRDACPPRRTPPTAQSRRRRGTEGRVAMPAAAA